MKNILLFISFAFVSQLSAQVELTSTSTKADSLAFYESIGDYKTIFSQKLFDPSLNKNTLFLSERDSLILIDSLFADANYRSVLETQLAQQGMILNGDWESRKEEIGEVIKSYSQYNRNPNYMENAIVQKDQILIEYFSLVMERTSAYSALNIKFPYYEGMSTNTKVKISEAYKEVRGISISPEEALEIIRSRVR